MHVPLEHSPPYGNRIGSATNRFYYYDSSKTKDKGDENDVSAAAISHIKKMKDDDDDEEIIVLSNMDGERNGTKTALKRLNSCSDHIIGSVEFIDEMEIDDHKEYDEEENIAATQKD